MYQHIISRKRLRCNPPNDAECAKRIIVQTYTQEEYHVAFKRWLQESDGAKTAFCYRNAHFMIQTYQPQQIRITMNKYDFVAMGIIVLNAAWNNISCVFTKHNIDTEQLQELLHHGFHIKRNPVAYLIYGPDIETSSIVELATCVIKRS